MDRTLFVAELAKIFEVEVKAINDGLALTEDNWDSLAQVSVMLALDEYTGKQFPVGKIAACKSIADIFALAAS